MARSAYLSPGNKASARTALSLRSEMDSAAVFQTGAVTVWTCLASSLSCWAKLMPASAHESITTHLEPHCTCTRLKKMKLGKGWRRWAKLLGSKADLGDLNLSLSLRLSICFFCCSSLASFLTPGLLVR